MSDIAKNKKVLRHQKTMPYKRCIYWVFRDYCKRYSSKLTRAEYQSWNIDYSPLRLFGDALRDKLSEGVPISFTL
jgi:hypothetical protein